MKTENFELVAKNEFRFLETHYNFRLVKCKHERWGYELIYVSDKIGIKITYEFNEANLFITLYKLVNGKLIENPRSIKEDTLLHGYSLDDIIIMLDPSALIKPAYQYGDDSKYYNKENGLTLQ